MFFSRIFALHPGKIYSVKKLLKNFLKLRRNYTFSIYLFFCVISYHIHAPLLANRESKIKNMFLMNYFIPNFFLLILEFSEFYLIFGDFQQEKSKFWAFHQFFCFKFWDFFFSFICFNFHGYARIRNFTTLIQVN